MDCYSLDLKHPLKSFTCLEGDRDMLDEFIANLLLGSGTWCDLEGYLRLQGCSFNLCFLATMM